MNPSRHLAGHKVSIYTGQYNTEKTRTSTSRVEFEPMIPVFERLIPRGHKSTPKFEAVCYE
jgi:hypothetical protein